MKKIIFTLLLVIITFNGFSQTKISGVITYYFNEYQGNKADIGASVILIDSSKVAEFDYEIYEKYHYGKFYQKLYFDASERYDTYSFALKRARKGKKHEEKRETLRKGMSDAEKDMNTFTKEMAEYEYDTNEKRAKVAVALFAQLLKLDEDLPRKTVNSNGDYSLDIEPGVYYVYIKSKNRKEKYLTPETDGKIYIKKVKISENEDKDVSYNFEL